MSDHPSSLDAPSETLCRRMLAGIRDYAIFYLTPQGELASWHPGVEQVLGYRQDAFVGRPGAILFTPEDRAAGEVQRELDQAAREGSAADNRWHLRQDGSRFWANGVVSALREPDGTLAGFVKVMRDNTREKEADEALQEARDELARRVVTQAEALRDTSERLERSEIRFAEVFRAAPFAAVISSPDEDRLLEVNDAFLELTGYTRDEVVGRLAKELRQWSSPDDQRDLRWAQDEHGNFEDLELHIRTKQGEPRTIVMSCRRLPMDGTSALVKMFYDISDLRRSEEELMHAIHDVMQDANWFSRSVVERLAQIRAKEVDSTGVAELTRRERDVVERIARGLSNEAIAAELGVAPQTVRNYISAIYQKIGVHSRAEAVVWARERGLAF